MDEALRWSYDELLGKIEWEGGIEGALEYGITADMVPEPLKARWEALQESYRAFQDIWWGLKDEIETNLADG